MSIDWRRVGLDDLGQLVIERAGPDRPVLVGVDGHSSSGKSTLARRLTEVLPSSAVLHTDDLAWHHGVLNWDALLLGEVLPVLRRGEALDYRPPGWVARDRPGSVQLPAGLCFLVVEGVGASQPSVRASLDVALWVEAPEPVRWARDEPRVAAGEISAAGWVSWMAEENAYVSREHPWLRCDFLVDGTADLSFPRIAAPARG